MLSRRLHENVLSLYGFKRISMSPQPPINKVNPGNKRIDDKEKDKSLERPSIPGLYGKKDPKASTTGDLRLSNVPASSGKPQFTKKSEADSSEYKG